MVGLGYTFTQNYMDKVYCYAKDTENYEIHTSVMTTNITPNADYISYFQKMWF